MSDRKHTPDILAEILTNAAPEPEINLTPPKLTRPKSTRPRPPAEGAPRLKPSLPKPIARPEAWEIQITSFQQHRGWRLRFIDGKEVKDWANGPTLQEYTTLVCSEGWELAGSCSGAPMFGRLDAYQLFFKRPIKS